MRRESGEAPYRDWLIVTNTGLISRDKIWTPVRPTENLALDHGKWELCTLLVSLRFSFRQSHAQLLHLVHPILSASLAARYTVHHLDYQ